MNRIRWQDESFELRRVVIRRDLPAAFGDRLRVLADALSVPVAGHDTCPADGDVWVGCSPEAGWGNADPHAVGWFSPVEVPVAIDVLRDAADRQRRYGLSDEPRYVGH